MFSRPDNGEGIQTLRSSKKDPQIAENTSVSHYLALTNNMDDPSCLDIVQTFDGSEERSPSNRLVRRGAFSVAAIESMRRLKDSDP
jgi:hypothetical protein